MRKQRAKNSYKSEKPLQKVDNKRGQKTRQNNVKRNGQKKRKQKTPEKTSKVHENITKN